MKKLITILATIIAVLSIAVPVFAISTADAKEPIDISKECSMEIIYASLDYQVENEQVSIYRLADMKSDATYSVAENFESYAIDFSSILDEKKWYELANTAYSYAMADSITPTASGLTDENGIVSFNHLRSGIYLISKVYSEDSKKTVSNFEPSLVAVPGINEDGSYNYSVSVIPKGEIIVAPNTPKKLTVVKMWKDKTHESERPESVEVGIFKDNKEIETVILSKENDWSYTWEISDEESNWSVVEKNVKDGYTVAIAKGDNVYSVINSYVDTPPSDNPPSDNPPSDNPPSDNPPSDNPPSDNPPSDNPPSITPPSDNPPADNSDVHNPPKTGDNMQVMLYISLLGISGVALLIIGMRILRKKNNYEKK